jgi:hypothetical protein
MGTVRKNFDAMIYAVVDIPIANEHTGKNEIHCEIRFEI